MCNHLVKRKNPIQRVSGFFVERSITTIEQKFQSIKDSGDNHATPDLFNNSGRQAVTRKTSALMQFKYKYSLLNSRIAFHDFLCLLVTGIEYPDAAGVRTVVYRADNRKFALSPEREVLPSMLPDDGQDVGQHIVWTFLEDDHRERFCFGHHLFHKIVGYGSHGTVSSP